ncbi:MAG: purine-nucleoside phosphorylase [Clostridia bacterium]|nr:purine-nucleoside phosphorylase [Clostridia bacterium]
MTYEEILKKNCDIIRSRTDLVPRVAVVLGSGLGGTLEQIDKVCEIAYSGLEGFPVSTVGGHVGRFIFGSLGGIPMVVMQGRVHYYEGYTMQQVVMPIRVMKMLGAEKLLLTNAAGGINPDFAEGSLMLLRDHISTFVPSPLIGKNYDMLGTRFPDMTEVYDRDLRGQMKRIAKEQGTDLKEGVYVQLSGPNYETPQEIRMLGILGADAVGMSTVCEAIAARHMGMKVCAVSCITNMAAGLGGKPLSHEEVRKTADRVGDQFRALVCAFLKEQ